MPRPEITANQNTLRPNLRELADSEQRASICEVLDRVLNKGVVVAGEVIISLAGVDLVSLNLNLMLTSIETARAGTRDYRGTEQAILKGEHQ